MTQVRVASAIADKNNLVLYLENGDTISVPQNDPRVAKLVEDLIPFISRQEIAVVDLENFSIYNSFTEKTGGLVRFFKIAKERVKSFFGLESHDEEVEVANATKNTPKPVEPKEEKPAPALVPTSAEILSEAVAVEASDSVGIHETVIAVVEVEGEQKIVPHIENIKEQVSHANKSGNTIGVQNLIVRMAKMTGKRDHSVEDLLRFLEKGDLPVADDGSIIAYKILRRARGKEDTFVDCHSGNVFQRIGSYVVVDESMVDKNRRNECSNGLHIARRGYLGSFSGDVCVLCKIDPEDVITVPHNDPNKVRVCGYHILSLIPPESFSKLKSNAPMTSNPVAAKLLAEAISGKHIERIEEVRITQSYGGGLKITPIVNGVKVPVAEVTKEELSKAKAFDDKPATPEAAPMSVRDVQKKIAEEEVKVAAEQSAKPESNAMKVRRAFDAKDYATVDVIKRKAKVSFEKLGLNSMEQSTMADFYAGNIKKEPETVLNPPTTDGMKVIEQALAEAPKPVNRIGFKKTKDGFEPLTNKEHAHHLHGYMVNENSTISERKKAAQTLLDLKKKSKISYEKLGLPNDTASRIEAVLSAEEVEEAKPQTKAKPAEQAVKPKDEAKAPETSAPAREWARFYFQQKSWAALHNLKKSKKVSWERLGFNDEEVAELESHK